MKPEFVDNSSDNTLAAALRGYLGELRTKLREPIELRVASGYFNPAGFAQIADELAGVSKVRLLLGAEPASPPAQPLRMPGDPKGPRFNAERVRAALDAHRNGLERDRDLLPFEPIPDASIRRLLDVLRSGKVEVRRYEKAFLHGKAYIFGAGEGTIVGSSNFTFAGLVNNRELNLGDYQPHVVRQVGDWFESLWNESAPFDLAALYQTRYMAHQPYLIYLRVLWELFGKDLSRPGSESVSDLNLTSFQRDGVFRARRVMAELGGVLVADEVGLGKTFLAGDIIRAALKESRQRVLIVAPAALRDGPWDAFLARHQLRDAEVISFEQLQRDSRLGADGGGSVLRHNPNDYALVVVDEAQAFRNPEALRSRALRTLLRGTPRKQLLLMSATPVNNSVWDLYTLLGYFLENDGVFAARGVPSLVKRFREVAAADPEELRPDALFDVIDATTVRRTRHFVKRYYPGETIRTAAGVQVQIRFPKPVVMPVNYDLDEALPGLFRRVRDALAPAAGEPKLTLARYTPDKFRKAKDRDIAAEVRSAALTGLLRSGILKRFESSAYAFACTLRTLIRGCVGFMKGLDEGKVLRGRGLSEIEDLSDTDEWDDLIAEGDWAPASEYNLPALRAAVQGDAALFHDLLSEVEKLSTADNPKLHALEKELVAIARQAEKEGHGDEQDRRKVLIFTFFEDTAGWIYDHLIDLVSKRKDLAVFRGRIAAVGGNKTWGGVSRDEAVFGFVPKSAEAPSGRDADRFDILVSTDVLAEGMNLQQARHIVNFDLPWNPMRLVQRHGRVDRIGSPHDHIFLRCFLPDRQLDALLALEQRLRAKIAQAAATIGLGAEVLPGSKVSDKAFTETREEIERLRKGDPTLFEEAGERPGAHSGEEFRHELLKAFEQPGVREAVLALPGAAGSMIDSKEFSGFFFCARVGDRVFLRLVPSPVGGVAEPGTDPALKDTLTALRAIACLRDTPPIDDHGAWTEAYHAWTVARSSIHADWMWSTDPANLQPKIRPLFRRAADHLRENPPPDVDQERLKNSIESLEAPRSLRVERILREAMDAVGEGPAIALSTAIMAVVDDLGLERYQAPKELPEIAPDEVRLVCWMRLKKA